ncbi:MAG: hypothetical protein ACRDHD_08070, partial [Candidatus Limnocylindria bacterium]
MASVLALGALLAAGPRAGAPDPPTEAGRGAALREAATEAERALDALGRSLATAIEHGRIATSLTVAGDRSPRAAYQASADELERASALAGDAERLLRALAGRMAA